MKLAIYLFPIICLIGCGKDDSEASAKETEAITIKSPNVTAEQSRKDMEKANIPPEAKKVLGGAIQGS